MYSNDWKERIRRYIHAYALLKHFAPGQAGRHRVAAQQACTPQTLIEQSGRSQSTKWRAYAESKDSRADRTSRPDVS